MSSSAKTIKLQMNLFWFIYSLHMKNMISPDMVMEYLECIKDISFIDSFSSSSMKHKYKQYMDTGIFPFQRHINHCSSSL